MVNGLRANLLIRNNLGFSILLKDTSTCNSVRNQTSDLHITGQPALLCTIFCNKVYLVTICPHSIIFGQCLCAERRKTLHIGF